METRMGKFTVLVLGGLGGLLAGVGAEPVTGQETAYSELWSAGQTYEAFYDAARGRRSLWEHNTERASVPPEVQARARAVPGSWRLLAVAFDRCSDSVSTLPYIAELVDRVDGLELRIIQPDEGRAIMEAYRTPDGRAATPTVLLLSEDWRPAGAFVERPAALQEWFLANLDSLSHDERYAEKMRWYDADAGASTIRELVSLLEAGASRLSPTPP